jgi:hemerythrin superfamily protein
MKLLRKDRMGDVSDPAKLLIADHQKVERLFALLEDEASAAQRRGLVAQLVLELTRHTELEETIVYPFVRAHVDGGDELIDEAVGEHDEAKALLARLEVVADGGDEFDRVLKQLRRAVQHHVKEEEKELLPKLGASVGEEQLGYLRGDLERAKLEVPGRELPQDDDGRASSPGTASLSGSGNGQARRNADVWVQPHHVHDDKWQVRREGATRASRVFDTQREAIDFGRQLAQRELVELIIAGRDGQVRETDTAGR